MAWKAFNGSHDRVPVGALEGDPGARPAMHVFVGSEAPGWEVHDDRPKFERRVPGDASDDTRSRRRSDRLSAPWIVGAVAFGASLLTLFSGFGLGTLLMPVFAIFFPIEVAVASTAVVHAANNAFKVTLLGREAPRAIVLRFGVPAIVAAFVGALALSTLSTRAPIGSWSTLGHSFPITPVKLVMGALILGFAIFELVPALREVRVPIRWLPLGGALSGFFGGLSGHQGALRAAFLSSLELSPTEFVSVQAVLGLLVDTVRLLVYGWSLLVVGHAAGSDSVPWRLVIVACLCAFAGAYLGRRLLPKLTVTAVHAVVGALLVLVGTALALGIV
jgi:hypothetical protein